jgi:transcriptional regulator with XRE-family HTH domain
MPTRTVLISPLDIDDVSDIGRVGARKGQARRVWLPAPGFGGYLRSRREENNLSLRKAGERVGISHTYLAQIETGNGDSHLPMELYERLAEVYDLDDREILDRAGYRYAVVEDVAERLRDLEEERFARLMLHPRFAPPDFTEEHLKLFPEAVRKYIIELVQSVDDNAREGGLQVLDIMDNVEEK